MLVPTRVTRAGPELFIRRQAHESWFVPLCAGCQRVRLAFGPISSLMEWTDAC
jgi:hypothetical protein